MPKSKSKRKPSVVPTVKISKAELERLQRVDSLSRANMSQSANPLPIANIPLALPAPPVESRVMIDLGCGDNKAPGFRGLDLRPGSDIVHDLMQLPWPFENDSVDEFRASHVLEHFWGEDQIKIMNETYRCLKFGGLFTVIVPAWNSVRMWQDPTHKSPFPDAKAPYFNKGWRDANRLDHYLGITADFDFDVNYQIVDPAPQVGVKGYVQTTRETQVYAMYYYNNVVGDVTIAFKKVKRDIPAFPEPPIIPATPKPGS